MQQLYLYIQILCSTLKKKMNSKITILGGQDDKFRIYMLYRNSLSWKLLEIVQHTDDRPY